MATELETGQHPDAPTRIRKPSARGPRIRKPSIRTPDGRKPSPRLLFLLGPAFVAAIAYVDPGNVAANLTAGARFGYLLVWVLVAANAIAMLIQYQSAKLGLATGKSLPELLGQRLGTKGRRAFWVQAELVAAATDIAEVIGGAIALNLLFRLPLFIGGIIVGVVSMLVLSMQSRRRQRTFESVIMGLLAVITIGFVAGLFVSPVNWGAASGGLLPRFDGSGSVLLAASMLGATVMPHAIYLHSSLARDRHGVPVGGVAGQKAVTRLIRATRWDVAIALLIAGAVNVAMLLLAAASLHGVAGTETIEGAHAAISASLGPVIGAIFAIGLLASGLASTSVGSYAGAVIMSGLLKVRVPLLLRRVVTLVPALVILGTGIEPTGALVLSQVLLSLGIPFAVIPLIRLTGDRRVMGVHVDAWWTRALAWLAATLVVMLNIALIVLTVTT
jgi:manganese transport protein